MTKKVFLILYFIAFSVSLTRALTLDECRKLAHDNFPLIRQYGLIEQTRDFTLDNAAKNWLPRISVSANAAAFTDILKETDQTKMMGIDMKNYIFSGAVTVSQTVYDGGQISANKRIAEAQADVQSRQTDVTLYGINERVEQIYFGILLINEQLHQNATLQNDLNTSLKTVQSLMAGGLANESDLDAIRVELVRAEQQKDALATSKSSYIRVLGIFIGKELTDSTPFEVPSDIASAYSKDGFGSSRPEIGYYASQDRLIAENRRLLDTKLRPTVSLFGTGAIHSSISDLTNNGLLMGGLTVSWNIGALYTRKNDIQKLNLQQSMNNTQRETFLFNLNLQQEDTNGTIASIRKQIEKDKEVVALRERIREKGEKKVQFGTESVNELVREINAVSMARQQEALHKIQLLQELYRLKNINNN